MDVNDEDTRTKWDASWDNNNSPRLCPWTGRPHFITLLKKVDNLELVVQSIK